MSPHNYHLPAGDSTVRLVSGGLGQTPAETSLMYGHNHFLTPKEYRAAVRGQPDWRTGLIRPLKPFIAGEEKAIFSNNTILLALKHNMTSSTVDMNPHRLAQPLGLEQNAYSFRYNQTPKLKDALEKAGRDFRSDVVTVPTEGMMQVRSDMISSATEVATYQYPGNHRSFRWRRYL